MVDILVFIEYSIVGTTPPILANEKAGFFFSVSANQRTRFHGALFRISYERIWVKCMSMNQDQNLTRDREKIRIIYVNKSDLRSWLILRRLPNLNRRGRGSRTRPESAET